MDRQHPLPHCSATSFLSLMRHPCAPLSRKSQSYCGIKTICVCSCCAAGQEQAHITWPAAGCPWSQTCRTCTSSHGHSSSGTQCAEAANEASAGCLLRLAGMQGEARNGQGLSCCEGGAACLGLPETHREATCCSLSTCNEGLLTHFKIGNLPPKAMPANSKHATQQLDLRHSNPYFLRGTMSTSMDVRAKGPHGALLHSPAAATMPVCIAALGPLEGRACSCHFTRPLRSPDLVCSRGCERHELDVDLLPAAHVALRVLVHHHEPLRRSRGCGGACTRHSACMQSF